MVVVEGIPGALQTESAEIKDVLANRQVLDLPVKDRRFLELALMSRASSIRPAVRAEIRCSKPAS